MAKGLQIPLFQPMMWIPTESPHSSTRCVIIRFILSCILLTYGIQGNSVLRGPEDVIIDILSSVSASYDPYSSNPVASLPCNMSRSLAFQIGGKVCPDHILHKTVRLILDFR